MRGFLHANEAFGMGQHSYNMPDSRSTSCHPIVNNNQ